MKIQIMSDLHMEHRGSYNLNLEPLMHRDADLLVLAGDIASWKHRYTLFHYLQHPTMQGRDVVYVVGNHEFYGADHQRHVYPELESIYERGSTKVYLGNRRVVKYPEEKVMIIAATLWSDISDPMSEVVVVNGLYDFKVPGLTGKWYNEQHKGDVEFITRELMKDENKDWKKVVVTHHGPTFQFVPERFEGSALNAGFYSDLTYLMYDPETSPVLWVHGHTHDPHDGKIGETRIICNPLGYPGEHPMGKFKKNLIVEV